MGRKEYLLLGLVVAIGSLLVFVSSSNNVRMPKDTTNQSQDAIVNNYKVKIGQNNYSLEIADSYDERVTGLANREELAQDSGMLFIFEADGNYKFWMKDTLIALDMIWLNSKGQVIYIEENVLPETFPQSFGPDQASRYVIELNAGQVEANGLKVGDQIDLGLSTEV